jgi:hypothetical protein
MGMDSYRRDFWNQQPVRCEVWSNRNRLARFIARHIVGTLR